MFKYNKENKNEKSVRTTKLLEMTKFKRIYKNTNMITYSWQRFFEDITTAICYYFRCDEQINFFI